MTAQDPYQPHMQPPPAPGPAGQPQQGRPQQAYAPGNPPYAAYPWHGYQMQPVQWPPMAVPAPVMVDGFYMVQPRLKPIPSGPAVGSLVAGIGGILGALPGLLFAAFSPWAGLTFFMMAALLGIGSIFLGSYAKRQLKQAAGGISGKGLATTGLILGIVATSLAGLTAVISFTAI
ncbi:hypothetical protein [Glycomyces arizonensis]|uniref:hypothetical protein n=1 Tax=Glycomyces arizonensis TaxID=256035 RepID=UPI0012EC236A|nr:hypothetical protein [Glycomyces arizonensis]